MYRRRSLFALYLVAFIDLFAVSLFLPLLSKEIRDLGGDPLLIGVIGSVYGGVQLFSSPVVGWGSDKQGSKLVLFVCLFATAIAYALQGYAASLGMLLIARAVTGCFKHTQTIGKSIIADLASQEKSHVLGNFNAFGSMGFIVGPTIGAHLVEMEGGFRTVCLLASVAFLVNIAILVLLISTKRKPKTWSLNKLKHCDDDDLTGGVCGGLLSVSSSSGVPLKYSVIGMLFLRFVFSSSTIIPRANLPLTLESKFGTGVIQVGYLNSMQALVSTLIGFAVGPVVSRFYHNDSERMVKSAGFVKMISILALVIAPTFQLAALSMLIQSAADPFLRVGITSMSLEGHDDSGTTILGLGQTATSLSRMLAPFIAGVAQSFSEDGPAIMGTFAALIGLIWSYMIGGQYTRSGSYSFWRRWRKKASAGTSNGNAYINSDEQPLIINEFNKKFNHSHLKL